MPFFPPFANYFLPEGEHVNAQRFRAQPLGRFREAASILAAIQQTQFNALTVRLRQFGYAAAPHTDSADAPFYRHANAKGGYGRPIAPTFQRIRGIKNSQRCCPVNFPFGSYAWPLPSTPPFPRRMRILLYCARYPPAIHSSQPNAGHTIRPVLHSAGFPQKPLAPIGSVPPARFPGTALPGCGHTSNNDIGLRRSRQA